MQNFSYPKIDLHLLSFCQIVILMWTRNNLTRPSRVADAATLAPVINKGLKSIQGKLNLPSQMYAFALVVGSVASVCFTVVGIFILSTSGESKGLALLHIHSFVSVAIFCFHALFHGCEFSTY